MTEPPQKRSKRAPWTLEDAYPVFLNVYPALLLFEECCSFWNEQTMKPVRRKLQHMVDGEPKLTGMLADVLNGNTRNRSAKQKAATNRAAAIRVPVAERQQNFKEAQLIRAFVDLMDKFISEHELTRIEWVYQFDGLRSDLLYRFLNDPPGDHHALQFKMCTFKRNMCFAKTNGYVDMILICGGLTKENIIKELLVFTKPLQQKQIWATHGHVSADPEVQAARTMTLEQIYDAMRASPLKSRDEWIYGPGQSLATCITTGFKVQQLFERVLGVWVAAPAEQNQAVDAYLGDCAVSFKTATPHHKVGFIFKTGRSKNTAHVVDVIVVGFRNEQHEMTSLGVMSPMSVDWDKTVFCWGLTKPFPGTLGLTTRDDLLDALRLYSKKKYF